MNAREIKFNWLGSGALACLWRRCRGWIPHVIGVALILASAVTVMAAGVEQSPDQLTTLSVLPTPTTGPSPAPSGGFYYTVQRGDTLFSIALRFGTTVQAIVNANGIINPNQIFYGQVFWIPSGGGGGAAGSGTYIVQRGDTLCSIARRFGTTYLALAAANGLHSPYRIYVGQRLVIPGRGTVVPSSPGVYIVRAGDTLYSIARRFGTTYLALAAANGLHSPYRIYVGQRLVIPGRGTVVPPSQKVYFVQAGDTLWSIALRYGTTPQAIAAANGLWNLNLIYVGQRLVIP
jgi:LysM repeat protein